MQPSGQLRQQSNGMTSYRAILIAGPTAAGKSAQKNVAAASNSYDIVRYVHAHQ